MFDEIMKVALEVKVNIVDVETIDKLNILRATKEGMEEIVRNVGDKCDAVQDQCAGDDHGGVEVGLDVIVEKEGDDGAGDTGYHHLEPHVPHGIAQDAAVFVPELEGPHLVPKQQQPYQDYLPQLELLLNFQYHQ